MTLSITNTITNINNTITMTLSQGPLGLPGSLAARRRRLAPPPRQAQRAAGCE